MDTRTSNLLTTFNSVEKSNDNCRLIFTERTLPHAQCIRVEKSVNRNFHWMSIFVGPQEKGPWGVSSALYDALFEKVFSACVRNDDKVYGLFNTPFDDELNAMIRVIRSSRVASNVPRGWVDWIRFHVVDSRAILTETTRTLVSEAFKSFGGWMIFQWFFIVSKSPLHNWKGELRHLGRRRRLREKLLRNVEMVFLNHYDHGVEILSYQITPNVMRTVADELSSEFHIPLKVQKEGDPLLDS